ncbi:YktB family protein [Paenibacillus silviterrae]|uniref:YktB family protein n=1 Tax=Paenibacillus silviterrae TaxID=3242194 RepID=UPI002542BB7A|nr:DUF1054 domain-containing protein [Paenibacillus chinjuensis]
MTFPGFTQDDFDVFTIPGLEPRMEALIANVRPKLHQLGDLVGPHLTALCGEEMFPHVAKHARRTINPPNDTWVAWAHNKKGYKAHPHFQVGMWSTHVFIQFALIYESPNKASFAEKLEQQWNTIRTQLPAHYVWSLDHMQPEGIRHEEMTEERFADLVRKLKHVKKSEALCGLTIDRHDPVLTDGKQFLNVVERTFETVLPLYRLSF